MSKRNSRRQLGDCLRSTAAGFAALLAAASVNATVITLTPVSQTVAIDETLNVGILADIDAADAIIGFGFDLALGGTGDLVFDGFTPGAGFADDPLFLAPISDDDGIRGASSGDLLLGTPASGPGILLGTLMFTAAAAGTVTVDLGADDLDFFFTEGLIPVDLALVNFLPAVNVAQITIAGMEPGSVNVPEPGTLVLLALGLAGLVLLRRRPA